MRRVLVINGHPDRAPHFLHAAAASYAKGAREEGHEVRVLTIAQLDFPLIRNEAQFGSGEVVADIRQAQEALVWAEHVAVFFPLWLGEMPALFKGFLEQVARPGFAYVWKPGTLPEGLLKGRSARLVVTMGMPAPVYRYYYRAHGVRAFKRNILEFCGFSPVRYSVIGSVAGSDIHRARWLERLRRMGGRAA